MLNETTQTRTRGILLSGWLIYVALANAWAVYRYYDIIKDLIDHSDPRWTGTLQWALPLLAIMGVVNIGAAIALWFWKKVGFYAILATSVVALVIGLMIGVSLTNFIPGLVGLGILWLLLQSRWHQFD